MHHCGKKGKENSKCVGLSRMYTGTKKDKCIREELRETMKG
jgi:hypothetical protein